MANARIMIVEDEGIVAQDIENRLTRQGYSVVGSADSTEAALRIAETQHPDLVLMDIRLKGEQDGIAAANLIRERWQLPVVFLTAYADDATLARARITEPFGYILKPFEERELRTVIEMALYKHMSERKLRDSEKRYATTLASIGDAVIATDASGLVTFLNPVAENLTGWTSAEAIGQALEKVFRIVNEETREQVENPVVKVLKEGTIVGLANHTVLMARGGKEVPVDDCASPIRDDRGVCTGAVLVFRDISESRRAEAQLRQSQRMEAVGQLAGGVAHDFNNLLTVIEGYSSLLLGAIDEDHAWHGFVQEIQKACERAATLTHQLLAYSRKQLLQPRVLNLNQIVSDLRTLVARLIGEHIHVVTALAPDLKPVRADPGQIEQVILNLVMNARDAMPRGGMLTIETANEILDEEKLQAYPEVRPGAYQRLTITDTGCGMDPAVQARIFEPFFTTKEVGTGTGMGLATVYGIIKQSSGHVVVESEKGKGSSFSIYVPSMEGKAKQTEQDHPPSYLPRGKETVLLVEDEEKVRTLLRKILSLCGYSVLEARDGVEAIQVCAQYSDTIHLLVTDMVMPQMTGNEIAIQLAAMRSNLKVLYISGYSDGSLLSRSEVVPGSDFLSKPFTPRTLAQKVRDLLDS